MSFPFLPAKVCLLLAFSIVPLMAQEPPAPDATPTPKPVPDKVEDCLIVAKEGLFNLADSVTLGLPQAPGTVQRVYTATPENWTFCHTPNIAVFQDRLYLMWSNAPKDEDSPGQVILFSTSDDGENWTKPKVLFDPKMISQHPDASLMSAGWFSEGGVLYAYATLCERKTSFGNPAFTSLWQSRSTDGKTWEQPTKLVPGVFLEGVKKAGNRYILLGQGEASGKNAEPYFYYTDQPGGQGRWQRAEMAFDRLILRWLEPGSFVRPDGKVVSPLRAENLNKVLYAAISGDDGKTWRGGPTNFPTMQSRTFGGNLPNGDAFMVCNPAGRRQLVIALSRDGRLFDRAFWLRNEAPALRFPGKAKGGRAFAYPSAIIWRDSLFVAYSVNKEDIEVIRVPLSELARP